MSGVFYLVLGNCLYRQKKLEQARRFYGEGLERSPEHAMLHSNFAAASYGLKRYGEAAAHFRKAYRCQKEPDSKHLYRAGVAYFQAERYVECESAMEELLRVAEGKKPHWVEILTYAYMRQDKWDKAERTLMGLLRQKPARRKYWKLLASVHLQRKKYREAAPALEIAYTIRPPDPSGWKELGTIYAYVGAPLEAAKTLRKAYGNPLKPEECQEIARLYARGFRYGKAISFLDRALEGAPSAKLYMEQGRLCYRAERFGMARDAFRRAAESDPERGEAYLWMGFAACQLSDWDLAHKAFAKAKTFAETEDQARYGLQSVQSILQAKRSVPGTDKKSNS
jgi:tetratricopeptide (TPR) repeat protein